MKGKTADMIYRNRLHFAAIIRRAIREGTLTSYERSRTLWRHAVIAGEWHCYEPAGWSMLEEQR